MKVIIAGSRTITDCDRVFDAWFWYGPSGYDNTILSGDATGVDACAKKLADEYDFDYVEYEAEWDEYGKAAGPIRNQEMAEDADMLVAVWDGESQGTSSSATQDDESVETSQGSSRTKNMIGQAVEKGLEIGVHVVDQQT